MPQLYKSDDLHFFMHGYNSESDIKPPTICCISDIKPTTNGCSSFTILYFNIHH